MSLKKTFLLLFLFLTPFIIVIPVSIGQGSLTKVFLDPEEILDTSLELGDTFTVYMSLDYVEPNLLWAYQLTLRFNPDVLHGVSVENGPFLGSNGGEVIVIEGEGFNNTKGSLWLYAGYLDPIRRFPKGGSDEYGPLCNITFEVVGYGSSPIRLGPEAGLANRTGGWIIHKLENPESFSDAYFDNRPPIMIDPKTVKDIPIGGSFTINVSVAEMADLYSWEFYMNWSAPLLNVTSVVEGDFLQPDGTQFHQEIHNSDGYIYANCTRTGGSGVPGSGTLAQVTFLVEDEGNCTLDLYDTVLLDSSQNKILHRTADGYFTNLKIHNIAVTSVTAFPSSVKWGSRDPVYINVTVENNGAFPETFNVTIYYDSEEIDMEMDIFLDSGANTTLTFTWDTTGVDMGIYNIKAVASYVAEEAYTADNIRISKEVIIAIRNISIITGIVSETKVNIGERVLLGVVVENTGTILESFNLTTYYNETAIETEFVPDLVYGESVTIEVIWNVTDVKPGLYLIKAETSDLPGEVDTSDNVFGMGVIEVVVAHEESLFSQNITVIAILVAIIGVTATTIVYRRIRKAPEEVW